MRRPFLLLIIVGCLGTLTVACFGRALFRGEQFAYRDAAHFYYPLYQRVQTEWQAGRWPPLWEPEENGGMPLLGNPTAAVLYPGKIVYAFFPYAWGARLYVVAHTLLAAAAMLALLRHWGVSWTGSALAALAYAFGGPILFQYCNIIYLVGAAWVPLGFRAADRWLRLGRRIALLELALVLAMETLGGDPEAAYLTGLAAGAYAMALAWVRRGDRQAGEALERRPRVWWVIPALIVALAAWVGGTLAIERLATTAREHKVPPLALPWMGWVGPAVLVAWALVGLAILARWRKREPGSRPVLVPMLGGLALAGVLGGAIMAAQLFPVLEFTGQTARAAGEGPHDVYPFSLSPTRVVEFVWPNLFGTSFQGNRSWLSALPPAGKAVKVWVPTLYAGGLTIVLALAAARWRGSRVPGRGWMTAVVVVSLLAALGEFTGPLLWARYVPELRAHIGPHDPFDTLPIRLDDHLRDGDGSFYWFLCTFLPGFRQFRFPCKLLTFTVMGLAALAGFGWDDLAKGEPESRRRAVAWSSFLGLLTLVSLGLVVAYRPALIRWLGSRGITSGFGPPDVAGAYREMRGGLIQGAVVMACALALALRGHRRPQLAAVAALVVMTADLSFANARCVLTVPQRLMDETPEVVRLIRAAEAKQPSPGPYRVHRTPLWDPISWTETASDDRVRDFVVWERETIQPKYGINEGVNYTLTMGVAELFDYEFYFGGFPRAADAAMAQALHVDPGTKVIYYPRRSFDMWTTRYFVLPYVHRWTEEYRGIAAFLDQTERIYPPFDAFRGPGGPEREMAWAREHDFQILRNTSVYPRAWVVHEGRFLPSITGMDRADRQKPMEELLYANDLLWHVPNQTVYDPKTLAWLGPEDRLALGPFLRGASQAQAQREVANVVSLRSDRVEIEAELASPGLVVLADVYYPGWTLTIDGRPAPVYRANRMMRGAAVEAGRHRLVYSFHPLSFRLGQIVSGISLALLAMLAVWFTVRPVAPSLVPDSPEPLPGGTP